MYYLNKENNIFCDEEMLNLITNSYKNYIFHFFGVYKIFFYFQFYSNFSYFCTK